MLVREVVTKEQFTDFIKFPWKIYDKASNWVPQLLDDYNFLLTERNPFWEHSEKALFLAYDHNEKTIGRIAAIIDHNYIKFQNEKTGFFGFFECFNEQNTADALFNEAEKWLKNKGMEKVIGPAAPSTNDEMGFLSEGFDSPPRIMMPYNPKYYLELAEKYGLTKQKELFAYNMEVAKGPLERLERIAQTAYKKNPGLKISKLNIKDFDNEIAKAVTIYNSAWEKNWGFVPWTDKEFHTIALKLKDLLLLDTTLLASIDNKPAGMLIAVPDYNFVLKKMNGKLFPLGILKFLYYKSKIKALRAMILGVVKEYRQKGIEGAMYYEALKNSMNLGYKECEFSWILDDNLMAQRAAEMLGGTLYKKYSVYGANL